MTNYKIQISTNEIWELTYYLKFVKVQPNFSYLPSKLVKML